MGWIDCPYCGEKLEGASHKCLEGKIAQLESSLTDKDKEIERLRELILAARWIEAHAKGTREGYYKLMISRMDYEALERSRQ